MCNTYFRSQLVNSPSHNSCLFPIQEPPLFIQNLPIDKWHQCCWKHWLLSTQYCPHTSVIENVCRIRYYCLIQLNFKWPHLWILLKMQLLTRYAKLYSMHTHNSHSHQPIDEYMQPIRWSRWKSFCWFFVINFFVGLLHAI